MTDYIELVTLNEPVIVEGRKITHRVLVSVYDPGYYAPEGRYVGDFESREEAERHMQENWVEHRKNQRKREQEKANLQYATEYASTRERIELS